jgi:hypothetical protein
VRKPRKNALGRIGSPLSWFIRFIGVLMLQTDDEWAAASRYRRLETLPRVTENPNDRLPAVVA